MRRCPSKLQSLGTLQTSMVLVQQQAREDSQRQVSLPLQASSKRETSHRLSTLSGPNGPTKKEFLTTATVKNILTTYAGTPWTQRSTAEARTRFMDHDSWLCMRLRCHYVRVHEFTVSQTSRSHSEIQVHRCELVAVTLFSDSGKSVEIRFLSRTGSTATSGMPVPLLGPTVCLTRTSETQGFGPCGGLDSQTSMPECQPELFTVLCFEGG